MSREARRVSIRPSWTGVAFVVEAMLLLVFLVGSLALFSSLFASSVQRASESRELTAAVAAASDAAERFAADPAGMPTRYQEGDLVVACDVEAQPREAGTYYVASIAVYGRAAEQVYALQTACYRSGGAL